MTTNKPDRLDRIEDLLEGFIKASVADRQASNKRMNRFEIGLEETRKLVDSIDTLRAKAN